MRSALPLLVLLLTGCPNHRCPATLPITVFCATPAPPPPDLACVPPAVTDSDAFRCQQARDAKMLAYAEALAKALKTCRKPETIHE